MTTKRGLSNGVTVSYGGNFAPTVRKRKKSNVNLSINRTGAQLSEERRIFSQQLSSLSFGQREALLGDGDMPMGDPDSSQWVDMDSDDEAAALQTFPPGEEALLQSHAGQEAIYQEISAGVKPGRGDLRTRSDRVQKTVNSWRHQLPALVDAYLALQAHGALDSNDSPDAWPLFVIGFDEHGIHQFSHSVASKSANETLIHHGYLGSSPDQPQLAFPLRLFEVYRQLHRVCPRFSMDALSKTLTHLHFGPRKAALQEQLTTAYDAYLEIIRAVDNQTKTAMGRTGTWYMDNVCPPCFYRVADEPPLRFSWLGCIDGNNSLKSVADEYKSGAPRADDRASVYLSDRWLTPQEVDVFKDEVADSQKKSRRSGPILANMHTSDTASLAPSSDTTPTHIAPNDVPVASTAASSTPAGTSAPADQAPLPDAQDLDEDIAWLNENEIQTADVEELAKCINTCVDRWRAAGPEARKKMFELFAVAGIFVAVCRHGHVLVMCDMIRSGELMKYPLAIVERLLNRYGKDIGLGYDIMCAFFKTLLRSSLGKRVVAMNLRGVVPAFHGYAHNRACQIGWHPLYVKGAGLEDFEECERTFGKSNHLASVTRLCVPFHRRQQIEEHFYFHDLDKHASSGNFIYQNYRQATEKIRINREQLRALERRLGTSAKDYEEALRNEQAYFKSLRSEPEAVSETVEYMDLLMKLHVRNEESEQAKVAFRRLDHDITVNGITRTEITRVNTRYRTTYMKYLATLEEVCRYEDVHNIAERWTPMSKSYTDALVMMTERRYRSAVDELERLVVQRLAEMTKLGMSGVGYKLRENISKALKTRAEAIRRALERYNTAGAALNPPRPRLLYSQILDTASLAEFDWLRETRQDIRSLPWAQPQRREAMVLYFGIVRAKEEKVRCDVEVRRLITAMYDDHVDYYRAIAPRMITEPDLAWELSRQWTFRNRIDTSIAHRLAQAARLAGFTGSLFPGERQGRPPGLRQGIPPPAWLADVLHLTTVEEDVEEEADDHLEPPTAVQQREFDLNGMGREEDFDEDRMVDLIDSITLEVV
ncbi:hypothetical protein FB451DRAFT_1419631 [Mycena latifolia]|nr:hypothetical protein FB451DRAFT_1419631 [Mycena latifolia]